MSGQRRTKFNYMLQKRSTLNRKTESRRRKNLYHGNNNNKKSYTAVLVLNKVGFKA